MEIQGPLAQLVIWNASDRLWRSGVIWNGEMPNSLPQNAMFMSYLTVLAFDQEVYVTLSISDDSIRTRFVYSHRLSATAFMAGGEQEVGTGMVVA